MHLKALRLRRGTWPVGVLAHLAALFAAPGQVAAQVTVTGTVVENTYSTAVIGATVRLGDRPPFVTDPDGAFRFTDVTPGEHTITVEAIGFRRHEQRLVVRADTALAIRLEVDPVRLEELRAEGGTITIKGTVYGRESGDRLPDAQVFLGTGQRATADLIGRYKVDRVPTGRAILVDITAIGHLPERIALVTARDTTLDVRLEVDSAALRRVAAIVVDLENRSKAVATARYIFDQRRLNRYRGWTISDLLGTFRFRARCLVVDEFPRPFGDQIDQYLDTFLAQEVGRIEVYDRGGMVRIYTKQFLAMRSLDAPEFAPIIYAGRWGLGSACY